MSDARKFAPKVLASAEERLTEIERKYGVIQERIQAYDEVLSQFAAVKKELKQARENTASLHDFCDSLAKEVKASISSITCQIQPLKNVQDAHERALQGHSSTITSMLEHATNKHVEIRSSIEEINSRMATWASDRMKINGFLDELKRTISEISNKQYNHSNSLDKLYADYIKFKDKTEETHTSLNKEIKKNKQSIDDAPDIADWASKLYGRVTSDMSYRDKQMTSYVDKKIDGLAQDFAADPLSAESVKASLLNELQTLALDGKNAYLKSNNCSQQIQILEKKVENLNLIIKKYELNK